jgi:hypothetical protein
MGEITYRIKVEEVVVGVRVKGGHVARLLVPVSVVVVRHHGDPVQVPGNARHVVAHVDDFLWSLKGSQSRLLL